MYCSKNLLFEIKKRHSWCGISLGSRSEWFLRWRSGRTVSRMFFCRQSRLWTWIPWLLHHPVRYNVFYLCTHFLNNYLFIFHVKTGFYFIKNAHTHTHTTALSWQADFEKKNKYIFNLFFFYFHFKKKEFRGRGFGIQVISFFFFFNSFF